MKQGRRQKWTEETIVRAIEVFVNETGYFPTKRDFNNNSCLPSYHTYLKNNVNYYNDRIFHLKECSRNDVPRLSYPSAAEKLKREYYEQTGLMPNVEYINFFPVFKMFDEISVSFFDTPIFFSHLNRWEEICDSVFYIKPTDYRIVLKNIGVFWKVQNKNKKEKDDLISIITEIVSHR